MLLAKKAGDLLWVQRAVQEAAGKKKEFESEITRRKGGTRGNAFLRGGRQIYSHTRTPDLLRGGAAACE